MTLRQREVLIPTLLAGALLLSEVGLAQGVGVIRGVVREDSTRRPVAGAEITIPGAGRSAITDEDGAYRLDSLRVGRYQLNIRRIGYSAGSFSVMVIEQMISEQDVRLVRTVASLDTMRVRAQGARVNVGRDAFEERRRMGIGHFYDAEDLERVPGVSVPTLLQAEAIGVVRPPVCGLTRRRVNCAISSTTRVAVTSTSCSLRVLIDGMAVGRGGRLDMGEPPADRVNNWATAFDISLLDLRSFEKVEIYRRSSEVPSEYRVGETECGLVLLWSRRRG